MRRQVQRTTNNESGRSERAHGDIPQIPEMTKELLVIVRCLARQRQLVRHYEVEKRVLDALTKKLLRRVTN